MTKLTIEWVQEKQLQKSLKPTIHDLYKQNPPTQL